MSRFQKGASNAFFVAAVEFLQGSYAGNVLSVNKLDRLGRSAVDISAAAAGLAAAGVRVHCLAPGGVDLTSAAGMLIMYVINAEAGFERDLHIERTQAGFRPRHCRGQASRPAAPSVRRGTPVGARTPCSRRQHRLACQEVQNQPADHHVRGTGILSGERAEKKAEAGVSGPFLPMPIDISHGRQQ